MKLKRKGITSVDELDILSAIWIMASNDQNPIMTYEGIRYRLNLPEDFNVKTLIKERGELFRQGIASHRLDLWKADMKSGKHLPSWIRNIEDEATRKSIIESLTIEDIFQSQFRATPDAPKTEIEVIKWGLEHIDRLRKANIEAKDQKIKKYGGMWIPLLSLLITLVTIISNVYLQDRTINTQVVLKKYEVSLKPKQEAFSIFMKSFYETYESAYSNNTNQLLISLQKMESSFYNMEPFLDSGSRNKVWGKYQEYVAMCFEVRKLPTTNPDKKNYDETFIKYGRFFHDKLYNSLFE
jgi:hypothetical protein